MVPGDIEKKHRPAGKFVDEAWCALLRESARGTTYANLSRTAGFGRTKVAEILAGHRRPTMDELLRIAGALGLPQLRVLAVAEQFKGISRVLEYVQQLEDQMQVALLDDRGTAQGLSVPASCVIAAKIIGNGRFSTEVKPVLRGSGTNRVHHADILLAKFVRPSPAEYPDRAELSAYISEEMSWYAAEFFEEPSPEDETGSTRTAVWTPRFTANRGGGGAPAAGAPASICVLGGYGSGAADVASWLAHALDYDFTYVRATAARLFSHAPGNQEPEAVERDHLEVARTFTLGAPFGRRRVWAASGAGVVAIARLLSAESRHLPLVVHLPATDELIAWLGRNRRPGDMTSERDVVLRLRFERNAVLGKLAVMPYPPIVIPVGPPESADLAADSASPEDLMFDQWAAASREVLHRLGEIGPLDVPAALRRMAVVPAAENMAATPTMRCGWRIGVAGGPADHCCSFGDELCFPEASH